MLVIFILILTIIWAINTASDASTSGQYNNF